MSEMKVEKGAPVFGLDIGTRNVVGTVGYAENDRFVVMAQEIREHHTRAMLDGQIHDIGRVASTIAEIRQALERKTGLTLNEVCIAAAGRVLKTVNVHVDTEFEMEKGISQEDLANLASKGVEMAFEQFQQENDTKLQFYCVGYSIVRYMVNDVCMAQPEYHKAKKLEADMIATFLPDDVVDGLYRAVELADLKVANMTLEPIAAIRVAIPEKFRLLNIAMVDVGAGTSDISITEDGSVIAYGMIPFAGDAITEAIAKGCLIDFATAEKIKTGISTKDSVEYEDIMGHPQKITAKQVLAACQTEIDKIAKYAADEIRKLNGGNSPSAVFLVGGGGKIKGFAGKIAEELGLDPARVAIRGEDIMDNVDFPEECCKDSTIITPIGICMSAYERNNNFIYITFNGKKIKLYDNNKLAVADAAIRASFSREDIFPKRGKELNYVVNGKNRVTKGELGESANIFVNGEKVDLNYKIKANDEIVIEKSTAGMDGSIKIGALVDYKARINVFINGEEMSLTKPVKVNGKAQSAEYEIQQGDSVTLYSYYTYDEIKRYLNLNTDFMVLDINGEPADKNSAVYSGDKLTLSIRQAEDKEENDTSVTNVSKENASELEDFDEEDAVSEENAEKNEAVNVFKHMIEEAANEEKEEEIMNQTRRMLVIVNQKPILMDGKKSYSFVDIFDYINFDTSRMQGSGIVTLINGKDAQYTQELRSGDKIEVYWK